MEKRIIHKTDDFIKTYKDSLKKWMEDNNAKITNEEDNDITTEFLQFLYDYKALEFEKEDFLKRKRSKNKVPQYDLCRALKQEGIQCTRRKKNGEDFCGTHIKGTPHGVVVNDEPVQNIKKIEVWAQEIKGINYYIDKDANVYNHQDIISNKQNPKIIAKWECDLDGNYSIPLYNI